MSGAAGILGGGSGGRTEHISRFVYYPETNSAYLRFTNWGDSESGENVTVNAELWFDKTGQWVGFDLDMGEVTRELYGEGEKASPLLSVIPLQSVGIFSTLDGELLRVRFRKGLTGQERRSMSVILDISSDRITGVEFLFSRILPDMFNRLSHLSPDVTQPG